MAPRLDKIYSGCGIGPRYENHPFGPLLLLRMTRWSSQCLSAPCEGWATGWCSPPSGKNIGKWQDLKDSNLQPPEPFRCSSIELRPYLPLQSLWIIFYVISKFLNRNRNISTSQLNALLRFHLKPINVIISHGSITIPNLEAGFPLRCFQGLSIPDIATEHCPWQDSSYTRGQFISVLSY